MVEQMNLHCETCGFPYPGDRATQELLRELDEGGCLRHARTLLLHELIRRDTLYRAYDALDDELQEHVRRNHPNIARGYSLALKSLAMQYSDAIVEEDNDD